MEIIPMTIYIVLFLMALVPPLLAMYGQEFLH